METKLTAKQENFCQAYIRLADKSAAYREAYDCSKMKPESINRKAVEMFENGNITARIEELQQEVIERNKITVDELIQTMAAMVRFDISDFYDENGNFKNIHDIPKEARLMISQIESDEIWIMNQGVKQTIGETKKIRTINKMDAIEKLMKHLGGYEKDNNQKTKVPKSITVQFEDFSEDED